MSARLWWLKLSLLRLWPLSLWLLCCLLLSPQAYARDWPDILTTPLLDPLLAQPPRLAIGAQLPGDEAPHVCSLPQAELAQPLSLPQAIDMALCHHPQVQAEWARIKLQSAQLGEARAAYLPVINMSLLRMKQQTEYPGSQTPDSLRESETRYTTLTWRILDAGARNANHRAAQAALDAVLYSHDAILQKVMANVIALYFEAQTAIANNLARASNEVLALQTLESTQKREAKGLGPLSDTLQAKTSWAKSVLEHARAQGQLEKALVALRLAIGLSAGKPLALEQEAIAFVEPKSALASAEESQSGPELIEQDLADWLRLAELHHPAILAARYQLTAAQEKLIQTRAEGLPTLDFNRNEYINGRPNQGLSATQTKETVSSIALNIPLFDGFARTYKVRGAQASIEIRQAEFEDTQKQILSEVAKAYADAMASVHTLKAARTLYETANISLLNMQRKYDQGLADIIEILNVQAALIDARQEAIRAHAEWHSARLRLLANAGNAGLMNIQR